MLDFIVKKTNIRVINKKALETMFFKGSTDSFNVYLAAQDFKINKKTIFIITPNLYEAQKYYDAISQAVNKEDVLFYPSDQTLTSIMALGSPEFKSERIYTLKQLMTQKAFIVVTTLQGMCQRQLEPQDYANSVKNFKKGNSYNISDIARFLISGGYSKTYTVEKPGEFSLRGHILDIYTLNNSQPYRLDFFDEKLEELKIFDVETQRSFENVENLEISPMNELFYTDDMKTRVIEEIENFFKNKSLSKREQEKLEQDITSIEIRNNQGLNIYIPFFNSKETTLLDFSDDKRVYMIDVHKMKINDKSIRSDLETYATTMDGDNFLKIPFRIELEQQLKKEHIEIDNFGLNSPNDAYDLGVFSTNKYYGNLELLELDLKDVVDTYRVFICITSGSYYEELVRFFHDKEIKYKTEIANSSGIYLLNIQSYGSFISKKEKIVLLGENDIFSYKVRPAIRYRSVLNQATKIRRVEDLVAGDFIVHYDYGIGRYVGLKTMELSKEKRDYLHIVYANEESLYVPMDQIERVLKFGGAEGAHPKLSKLGGKQWSKTKASIRMKIKDLSDRLIKLYAQRSQSIGFSCEKDSEMQIAFERDFNYETTKDQQKAIVETKFDMEQKKPMDRLICGDVGFGKTEVALRAAFKAVLNTKQVLYLVPTTVLARQHYYTFKQRFDKYGANIALLSRFVTKKRQNEIIEKLKKGYVDVVIGTHRLLSSDIKFKDLGLLIVDEEQRFGVEHKERIREFKVNVDTLTLSATPIPRTLQMSMMKLKDLSMIQTPPLNRYPVQTYIVEYHEALIKEAITREIARGGQVFYLFNRVQGIQGMVNKLSELIPEAKITYAHGKMNRNQLENTLSEFIDHRFDVLVSTTIIETGVDIPNTNTIIIHEADKLGLSQLYQIRGRVGRSDRIAYAYLLYDANKNINDEAKKRLTAIQSFTALGSGYKIAMRDLSIRGAGDVLGSEQSGFIDSVGMELYMKLLEEAITGVSLEKPNETVVDDVYAARHVDPKYVSHDSVRIEIHKRISRIDRVNDVKDLKMELTDRFGTIEASLLLYMYEKLFKKLSAKLGVQKTIVTTNEVTLVLSLEASQKVNGAKIFNKANNSNLKIKLAYIKGHIHVELVTKSESKHWLYLFDVFLDDLLYN